MEPILGERSATHGIEIDAEALGRETQVRGTLDIHQPLVCIDTWHRQQEFHLLVIRCKASQGREWLPGGSLLQITAKGDLISKSKLGTPQQLEST